MPEWSYIIIRSLGAIVMLFILTRILGKKQISQLTFFEYITGIALGDLVGFMSTDVENNYWNGIAALLTWFLVPLLLETVALKSKTLRLWLEGRGTVFIKDGKIMEKNLRRERYTVDEMMEQLRTQGVFNPADVQFAILESSGDLSVLLRKENQPITPKMLGMRLMEEGEPRTVISDGVIMDEALSALGLSRGWINGELARLDIPLSNVFLAIGDSVGKLYIDLYDDRLENPRPKARDHLYASMRKTEADLELAALRSAEREDMIFYKQSADNLRLIRQKLKPYLKEAP